MNADNEKKVDYEEVEIFSQSLKKLMFETDDYWRDAELESKQPLTAQSPFYPFVWRWDDYVKACEDIEGDSPEMKMARKVLKDLLPLISSSYGLEAYFRARDTIRSSKKIKYDHIWTLFRHGAKVYARSYMNEIQMFEVKSSSGPSNKERFRVTCSAFDWDGSKFSTYTYDFYIQEYASEKPISSLEIFPIEYYCDENGKYDDSELRQQLLERGRKYCDLCTKDALNFQCEYQGTALVTPNALHRLTSKGRGEDVWSSDPRLALGELNVSSMEIAGKQSRVIIDNFAFLKSERNTMKRGDMPPLGKKAPFFESGCVCAICKSSPLQQWRPNSTIDHSVFGLGKTFTENEERLLFLPPRLLGFALKDKVWGQFLVTKLEPVSGQREQVEPFWDELQLEKESKDLLMAFVRHHEARTLRSYGEEEGIDAKAFDVIEGKGQGLAILLHGPPGVGKTLTVGSDLCINKVTCLLTDRKGRDNCSRNRSSAADSISRRDWPRRA